MTLVNLMHKRDDTGDDEERYYGYQDDGTGAVFRSAGARVVGATEEFVCGVAG